MRFYGALCLLVLGLMLRVVAFAAPAGESEPAVDGPPVPEAAPVTEAASEAGAASPTADLPQLALDDGAGRAVVIIPIHGTVDLGLAPYVKRLIDSNPDAAAIVLDVDTFGGRIDAAVQIRDALLAAKVPTVAFVNRRAISAGALISLGAQTIVFAPGGSMGAATPVQIEGGEAKPVSEKMVSYMAGEMRATAEARHRRPELAAAMADSDIEVEGVIEKGKLLTVTTQEARALGLSDGEAPDLDGLLAALGLGKAERLSPDATWAEDLARFLTDPTFSGLLMSVGMLGLLIELYTPGLGWTGAIGLTCLGLFFFGHMTASLAGWEELLVFFAGLSLLGLEIFVLPGFGVAGVLGIALLILSLAMSMVGLPLSVSWSAGLVESSLTVVLWSTIGAFVLLVAALQFLPARGFARWLVLEATLGDAEANGADGQPHVSHSAFAGLVGLPGVATTDLRLSGKARIDGKIYDVVSQQDYLLRGTPIRVVLVQGPRIVVERVAADRVAADGDAA